MTIVLGHGRIPNQVLLCGEAPGKNEAKAGIPFVGRAGREQEAYLSRHGLSARYWYRTNVVKLYQEGDPDPTPAQIREWTPSLEAEIEEVRPDLVIAVGAFAVRWFLGEDASLDMVHGIPHPAGAFDPSRSDRAGGAVVLPIYHPALGFYDSDARTPIAWDYEQVASVLSAVKAGREVRMPRDEWAGREVYKDISGRELSRIVDAFLRMPPTDSGERPVGLDTEGTPDNPWSVQVGFGESLHGTVLRVERDDFEEGVAALQRLADSGTLIVIHNALYDIEMCRAMGVELGDARVWDTMYAAYLLRTEPQGLKPLAWRWCGMRQASYQDTVGDIGREKQVDYLCQVTDRSWPRPEARAVVENDGTSRVYRPQPVARRAEAILVDLFAGKWDKDGNPVDPLKRWGQVDGELRAMVEEELGPMPVGTLGDIGLEEAVRYSARDADAALRLYRALLPELARRGHPSSLMGNGMGVLPIFEEMQFSGMPASRGYFEDLAESMAEEMHRLRARISFNFLDGAPFNPGSSPQVAALMRKRGLRGTKKTKTGAVSTGKKSIEHLRYQDDAIGLVMDWREHQKIRDSFCGPVLDRIPEDGPDPYPIRCSIKTTRVHTRRLAAADPNLLAIPVRHELGRLVREGYRCPDGEVFGAWDLSQVEMRVMAHLSGDPLLCRLFREGRDVHRETAARIFHLELDEVEEMAHRYPAKRAGFGIITNIQGAGLYDQLRMFGCEGWDEESSAQLIEDWLGVFHGVKEYLERCRREVRRDGMVRDYWGMPRYLPGVWAVDRRDRAEAERAASSHKIQGGAQGMIQNSMRWLGPRLREIQREREGKGRPILGTGRYGVVWSLQVHDEIILRFNPDLTERIDSLVMEALTQHHGVEGISVPIEAEGHIAQTWGGLK